MYFERFWRKATPQDAIKQPSMVARCLDDNGKWNISTLTGYDSDPVDEGHNWLFKEDSADNAQVYDPPANFELGEGYEFVDPVAEPYARDIEYWSRSLQCWKKRSNGFGKLNTTLDIYRRKVKIAPKYRLMKPNEVIHSGCLMNYKNNDQSLDPISPGWMKTVGWVIGTLANHDELNFACPIGEPLESYEPFTWDDRYLLIGKLISHKTEKRMIDINKITHDGAFLLANCINAKTLVENYVFDDTKLLVGKRVTKVAE